jgi:hypothetical protein
MLSTEALSIHDGVERGELVDTGRFACAARTRGWGRGGGGLGARTSYGTMSSRGHGTPPRRGALPLPLPLPLPPLAPRPPRRRRGLRGRSGPRSLALRRRRRRRCPNPRPRWCSPLRREGMEVGARTSCGTTTSRGHGAPWTRSTEGSPARQMCRGMRRRRIAGIAAASATSRASVRTHRPA